MKYISEFTGSEIDEKLRNAANKADYTPTSKLTGTEKGLPLQKEWENLSNTSKYYKDADDTVIVNIAACKSSVMSNGETIAELPLGYRPKSLIHTSATAYPNFSPAFVRIDNSGKINAYGSFTSETYLYATLTFKAAN